MPNFISKPTISLLFLLVTSPTNAFNTQTQPRAPSTLLKMKAQTRRTFGLSFLATTLVTTSTNAPPSHATVFADPDRYGDKELKIALVNKLRQNVRDAILQNPSLAPLFLKIAIQDALTYNAATGDYGPDGTIVDIILSKDAPASLAGLKDAAQKLRDIAKKIKKQTEITMADVVTFAGAEAIETAGGPRIVVQLGKMDPKKLPVASNGYPDLCKKGDSTGVVDAFLKAGLSEREVALLYGALADMEGVASNFKVDEEEEEENEMGDKAIFIPTSFGAPNQIYGETMGKMTGSVYKDIAKDLKSKKQPVADVFLDEKVGGWAVRYAGNPAGFLKDLPEAYGKVMGLGLRYTGGKVGNLLGGAEPSL